MGTLDPNIPSHELSEVLNDAAALLHVHGQRVLTPEMVLLAFLRTPRCAAAQILARFAEGRGVDLADLEREVASQARMRRGRDADFDFTAHNGRPVPLSDEMVVVLDEGRTIAEAMGEVWVGTQHALAAMSQAGVSTAGLLQRRGITPSAMTEMLADQSLARSGSTSDWVAMARQGDVHPVYFREALLSELMNLLSLSGERHVILVGAPGVGKRSLVYALALLIAEGRGPDGIASVVSVADAAYVDNAVAAIRAGLRKAKGGVFLVPDIHRFFGGVVHAELPDGAKPLQRAFFQDGATVIGTTTPEMYDTRLKGGASFGAQVRALRVPPTDESETTEILRTVRPALENEYAIQPSQSESRGLQRWAAKNRASSTWQPIP